MDIVAPPRSSPFQEQLKLLPSQRSSKIARHAVVPLAEGTEVWLKDLSDLPALHGDPCAVVDNCGLNRVAVRRFCTGEIFVVGQRSIALQAPDDADATRGVLSRVLGVDAASHVVDFATCQRCWSPCIARSVCRIYHPVKERVYLGANYGAGGGFIYKCLACVQNYLSETNPGYDG